jgi:hypothetical protein
MVGSVAERIVRTARPNVWTFRYPEHEFVLPHAFAAVAET